MAVNQTVLRAMDDARTRWRNSAPALRSLKRLLGVTDQQIGDALGLGRQTVQNRLSGATQIPPWELEGMAVFFEVPVEALLEGPEAAMRWVLDHPNSTRCGENSLRNSGFLAPWARMAVPA